MSVQLAVTAAARFRYVAGYLSLLAWICLRVLRCLRLCRLSRSPRCTSCYVRSSAVNTMSCFLKPQGWIETSDPSAAFSSLTSICSVSEWHPSSEAGYSAVMASAAQMAGAH
ncbi:hypothetical protein NEOLEDRAFT_64270 [Neolentinus lepideus HHB14362 ss-1]|uniref:Uncharacterized protein n=1 Tax=Neolentinus lepideus HHB14362 ss-1 TaxID=1314782 RepID=A0A165U9H7_9AGAM|nr:hypothetical protein NEOLEDRAFT_64270 [Neolentinus lepideus HHB14362 ss-1]